jgi:chemotaxis-related protein WspD
VQRYHPKDLRLTPATLRKAASGPFTTGVLCWKERTVACLDESFLLYALNRGLA